MRLYIPNLGDQLYLAEPWTFTLHLERRNIPLLGWLWKMPLRRAELHFESLYRSVPADKRYTPGGLPSYAVTLPKDTVLTVDRIYIRQGGDDYASVTFRARLPYDKRSYRFWAKLDDVNRMELLEW